MFVKAAPSGGIFSLQAIMLLRLAFYSQDFAIKAERIQYEHKKRQNFVWSPER